VGRIQQGERHVHQKTKPLNDVAPQASLAADIPKPGFRAANDTIGLLPLLSLHIGRVTFYSRLAL
jgi:hypothetical protein